MLENNIQVKLGRFDGPLSLLLHLIQKEEMSIRDLDINEITKQYLDYLKLMKDLNFDVAGEYLYMAASLLFIKSKTCVSEEEEVQKKFTGEEQLEITSKTELIERLEQLERFKKLGERLWSLEKRDHEIFTKPKVNRKAIVNTILAPMDLESLTNSMIDILRREHRKHTIVKRDRLSIKEKLISLKNNLKLGEQAQFTNLINTEKGLDDVVITFISLLELARLKKIEVFQNQGLGEIYVNVVEDLNNFNVETATGFEDEEASQDEELAQIAASGTEVTSSQEVAKEEEIPEIPQEAIQNSDNETQKQTQTQLQ